MCASSFSPFCPLSQRYVSSKYYIIASQFHPKLLNKLLIIFNVWDESSLSVSSKAQGKVSAFKFKFSTYFLICFLSC